MVRYFINVYIMFAVVQFERHIQYAYGSDVHEKHTFEDAFYDPVCN